MLNINYTKYNLTNFSAASFLLTEYCNFGCTYCYEKNGLGHSKNKIMSTNVAKRAVDFLFEQSNEPIDITLFGGEPCLNYDAMQIIFETCLKNKKETNKDCSVSIITNGSILYPKLYNLFDKYKYELNFAAQLSIDGPKYVQDISRPLKSGKSSFNLIIKNLKLWKQLFQHDELKLNIHGVLNADTIPYLYESYLYFREEIGVKKLWFLPTKDDRYNNNHVQQYEEQLYKIYEYILKKAKETNTVDEIRFYSPLDKCLVDHGNSSKLCGAGVKYCTIIYNGDIYPCHHIYFIDKLHDYKLGNIYTKFDIYEKLLFSQYDSKTDILNCSGCEHETHCYRCFAENVSAYQTPFTQIKEYYCEMMKIDYKMQKKLNEELRKMGLLTQNNNKEEIKDEQYLDIIEHDLEFKQYVMEALAYLIEDKQKGDLCSHDNKS